MLSPSDSPIGTPNDPFIIESSSQLSCLPRCATVIPSNSEGDGGFLKPYIVVFRLDPFTTHDGVHGRPVPASARAHSHPHPEDIQSTVLEFQLSPGSPPSPTPESESNSAPDLDTSIKPGPLRYLDGDTAPSPTFSESPETQPTWSPVPLFHPLPQPTPQSFPRFDGMHRSPATFHAHSHFNDEEHPFTRVNHTPASETSFQQSPTLIYPPSLAHYAHQAGSGSESMYAPQSGVEEGQGSSNGYRYTYSSSHTSIGDGYQATHVPVGSYSYSQDAHQTYASQPQQSFSFSFARGGSDTFATPAQMSDISRQEDMYHSAHGNPSPTSMPYSSGNFNSTKGHPLGHAGQSLNPGADDHCRTSGTQLYDGNRRGVPLSQNDDQVRGIGFSCSPHQTQPDLIRPLSPPVPVLYDSYSREPYFQTSPRGYDQTASRGYGQGPNRFEQPASEPQYNSRPPSSAFDRRSSLTFERSTSRTSYSSFNSPPSGAFIHTGSGTLGLAHSGLSYPPASHVSEHPGSYLLDRPASSACDPFSRCASVGSSQSPGAITPVRVFDSPGPARAHTISPTPSTTSSSADRRNTSRTVRPFPPFPPGGMTRSSGGKKHWCVVCNQPFTRPSTLAAHLNSHTGEKPHLCPVKSCGRRFSVSSNLRRHVKTHKLQGLGPVPRAQRNKPATHKEPEKLRPRVLQERKNVQSWCPESLRGMRNAKDLSSRPPFDIPEGAAPLRAPLPVVRPRGQFGDENYEDRDSFFYAHETDQPIPYHPLAWGSRPTLPGPLPSHADREARARSAYGYGGTLSSLGTRGDHHRV